MPSATDTLPTPLKVGTKAPAFNKVVATGGISISLKDFEGSFLVMVFYPKDSTPGCTRQLCALRDDLADFSAANTKVIGVNQGSLNSHENFVAKQSYNFPILVDEGSKIAQAYGAQKENGGTQRTVYIINPQGQIIFAEQGMPTDQTLLEAVKAAS